MLTPLAPADLQCLVKLLALTAFPFNGEALHAARAAHPAVDCHPVRDGWREIDAGLAQPGALTSWERRFLFSLRDCARLSLRQRVILEQIASRVLGRAKT
jgi:hypothetical protein